MAVNTSRSQNADLRLGATDGTFKNTTPNRGGEVEMKSPTKLTMVLNEQYNFVPRSPLAENGEPTLSL
jgi:hypothetical protein